MIPALVLAALLVGPADPPAPPLLDAHKGAVTCVAYARDGRTLASGGKDGVVRLWDLSARKVRHTFAGHGRMVTAVAFSPDGKILATTRYDPGIHLRDAPSGQGIV